MKKFIEINDELLNKQILNISKTCLCIILEITYFNSKMTKIRTSMFNVTIYKEWKELRVNIGAIVLINFVQSLKQYMHKLIKYTKQILAVYFISCSLPFEHFICYDRAN